MTKLFRRAYDVLTVAGLIAVTAGLIIYPTESVKAAGDGVELCFNVLVPSLLPFFVISTLTVELGVADSLGRALSPVMEPLFNVSGQGAPALILGILGGYPVGARTVTALYRSGRVTRAEAERMLAFCNNSGPAFILGVVGAGIFSSGAVGLVLYLTHVAASLLVGIIFRSWGGGGPSKRETDRKVQRADFPKAFVEAVGGSFTGLLNICGFVVFFTVLIKLLFLSGVTEALSVGLGECLGFLGLDGDWARRLITGFIELTSGVWSLREARGELTASVAMAAFMLGWAGLSVHCQVLSFLVDTGLSAKTYLLGKLLHGLISAGLAAVVMSLVDVDATVSAYLAQQVTAVSGLSFGSALAASVAVSAGALALFLGAGSFSRKRGGKNGADKI